MLPIIALIFLLICLPLRAEQQLEPVPEPPELPPPVESGEPLEPDVTIIRRGDATIQEFRIHNRLYMVRIQPSIGPAYYVMDNDGDGIMDQRWNDDVRGSDIERTLRIPQWVLLRW